jgi:hypothetical protein
MQVVDKAVKDIEGQCYLYSVSLRPDEIDAVLREDPSAREWREQVRMAVH